jgi:hypothetical protein
MLATVSAFTLTEDKIARTKAGVRKKRLMCSK